MNSIPASVYHLLINEYFPLKKVIEILPYLDALGIEGIYCSPLFEAESVHCYDIVNPNRMNPKIGTIEDFDILCSELQQRNMKLVLDVVPNHMGIKGKKNQWWLDVLENGPKSSYADFFDIDWSPFKRELKNKVLLPILGDSYGQSLLNGKIQLFWEGEGFWFRYDGYQLPLAPETYSCLLEFKIEPSFPLSREVANDWLECL